MRSHHADRRFNRARYDAGQTVAAFVARLKDAVDLDSVRDDLAGIVQQALEPARISVWVPAARKIRDTTASAARERRSPLASGGA